MDKTYLKDWTIVELRNGERKFVMGRLLLSDKGDIDLLDGYLYDLYYDSFFCYSPDSKSKLDIMKIYIPRKSDTNLVKFTAMLSPDFYLNWNWVREEIKEVTMAEVEERFGCKVKIIKEETK